MIEKVNKHNQINPKLKGYINSRLQILNGIRNDLPFDSIHGLFRSFGLQLIQEDGTDFEVILTGSDGSIKMPVAEIDNNNTVGNFLIVNWHKYDKSTGRFDLNIYLS